jgi:hypothetical protein
MQDASDPLGGSSQFKYCPYLLALSNSKKSRGCAARWAAVQSPSSTYIPDRRESALLLGPPDLDPSPKSHGPDQPG